MEISRRKTAYPVGPALGGYLESHSRSLDVPAIYRDLARFSESVPYESPDGTPTLWQTVIYPPGEMAELRPKLAQIYVALKMGGRARAAQHLDVERIDFGEFGNSRPFRIRIVNRFNDNFDHYYVKVADASRIYGLELEDILSPNRVNFLVKDDTLIEEHIAGVPGDIFISDYLGRGDLNRVRIAKEFVKFNERCFARLLGDMRPVNYVVDVTPDFEEVVYRVRPTDFDQQCYEGHFKIYLPQFFKGNFPVVELVTQHLNRETIEQYQREERTLIARRYGAGRRRLESLFEVMAAEPSAPPEHLHTLRSELAEYHGHAAFARCASMGELVRAHVQFVQEDE